MVTALVLKAVADVVLAYAEQAREIGHATSNPPDAAEVRPAG